MKWTMDKCTAVFSAMTEEELEIFRRAAKKMLRNLQQSRGGEEKG